MALNCKLKKKKNLIFKPKMRIIFREICNLNLIQIILFQICHQSKIKLLKIINHKF